MNRRVAISLLITPAIVLSYLIVLVGHELPFWNYRILGAKSWDDAWIIMSSVTRAAVVYVWVFPTLMALICLVSLALLRRVPQDVPRLIVTGLCAQGVVAWLAMFCFCYDFFTGPMCLHHGPEFEIGTFLTFGAGAFPVTLAVIVVPLLLALFPHRTATS